MSERVGIVAVAQTKYEPNKVDQTLPELVFEVVDQVLKETGLEFKDDGTGIDSAVSASQDHWDGHVASHMQIETILGAYRRPGEKVADDGILAVYSGVLQILSGRYDVVILTSHCKESENSRNIVENFGMEPHYHRRLGLDYLSAAAMQMCRYMHKYHIREDQCAQAVVKNRKNAKKNPYACAPADLTVKEVLASKVLAYPVKSLDTKPVSDGACAMILAKEEKAKKFTKRPVWIRGMGISHDHHYLGDRDLADCDSLVQAAQRAYKMAGITNPRKELDLAEISEEYSYQELLWTEGLGFCARGEGGALLERGVTGMGGELPVNPSGGVLSGIPTVVAGMSRVVEACLQLRGQAGARQVEGAKTALAHGTSGPAGQSHAALILGT